jgi:DNA-binding response OmpR family regulator
MVSDRQVPQHVNDPLQQIEEPWNVRISQDPQSTPRPSELSTVSAMKDPDIPFAVVIIDDDDGVRVSTRMLLEVCGYVVRDHASAESFLATDRGAVGVLLVDQHMPGMTGVELLELIHTEPNPPPALMLSGCADQTIVARLDRIGAKLMRKPVAEDELIREIEAFCCARPPNQIHAIELSCVERSPPQAATEEDGRSDAPGEQDTGTP